MAATFPFVPPSISAKPARLGHRPPSTFDRVQPRSAAAEDHLPHPPPPSPAPYPELQPDPYDSSFEVLSASESPPNRPTPSSPDSVAWNERSPRSTVRVQRHALPPPKAGRVEPASNLDASDDASVELVPSSPPVPAPHPSQTLVGTHTGATAGSSERHDLAGGESRRSQCRARKTGGVAGSGRAERRTAREPEGDAGPRQPDPRRIVDPRLRGRLGVEPEFDPRTMRAPPHAPKKPRDTAQPAFVNTALSALPVPSPVSLDRPAPHSSKLIEKQIESVKSARFDPVHAMAALLVNDRDAVRQLQDRVTSKALNVGRNVAQYSNLVSLDPAPDGKRPAPHRSRGGIPGPSEEPTALSTDTVPPRKMLPRARKSVSQSWLANLGDKPDYDS
ncbi:hypothetical protein BDK51DRAFT_27142, partial [Blyttiomyces helicus]